MASSWICVDANLVVRLVVDPHDTAVHAQWEQWDAEGYRLAAPALLHYETTNALYQYQRRGLLSAETVYLAQEAALALPLTFYGDPDLHRSAVRLAHRLALPATYDAHYLVVAQHLDAELWTADRRLLQAVQDTFSWVRLVAS
jgi:predicted nucleic acid-binding protein